jgi:hypothetical protein
MGQGAPLESRAGASMIDTLRLQNHATPVTTGSVPRWLTHRLVEHFRTDDLRTALGQLGGSSLICDHAGTTDDGQYVLEPYCAGPSDLAALILLVDYIGCRMYVSGKSWWFPGRTLRIVIEPEVNE